MSSRISRYTKTIEDRKVTSKLVTRFHIFREGEVSELSLLDSLLGFTFEEYPQEIFNLVSATTPLDAQQNITNLTTKLFENAQNGNLTYQGSSYEVNEEDVLCRGNVKNIEIMKDDYLFWLVDFDIFGYHHYVYKHEESIAREKAEEARRIIIERLPEFYQNINNRFNFVVVPSYCSIEYPIALGCKHKNYNELFNSLTVNKSSCICEFKELLNRHISFNEKNFDEIIFDQDKFSCKQMILFSKKSRQDYNQILTCKEFNQELCSDVLMIKRNTEDLGNPFTYIDFIDEYISDLYLDE